MKVLITGCSSGFGTLMAATLARAGHDVAATMRDPAGRNAEPATKLAELAASGAKSLTVVELDVGDPKSIDEAVSSIMQQLGAIDVVINNAGMLGVGAVETFTDADAVRLFDTNVMGPMRLNNAVLPHMRAQGSGLLVHVSSIVASIAVPFLGVYTATKAALESLAENYRFELRLLGIDSVVVQPGAFPTEIGAKGLQPSQAARFEAYGPVVPHLDRVMGSFAKIFEAPSPPDPQQVASVVRDLIERPFGSRPFRTVVDPFNGDADKVNDCRERYQLDALRKMGVAELME